MTWLLCCSGTQVQETKTKPKVLEISPDANIDTFGQVERGNNGQLRRYTGKKQHTKTRPTSNNSSHSDRSVSNKRPHIVNTTSLNSSTPFKPINKNKKPDKPPVQKQEIAIQAGSPLSKTRSKKTKTILSFSKEEDPNKQPLSLKNPFGILTSRAGDIKTLNPLRKAPLPKRLTNPTKGDITLDPIDTSIPKKLVPVDKDFLKRLEKATSQSNEPPPPQQQQQAKPEFKRNKTILGETKRDKNVPVLIKKRSKTTTESKKKPEVTDKSKGIEPSPFKEMFQENPGRHQSENNTSSNNDDSNDNNQRDNDMYDSDEQDLMDEIEKEFASIMKN